MSPTAARAAWPPPGRFRVGDMVLVHDSRGDEPGLVIEVNPHSAFPYRVGGAFTNGHLWDAWFPDWQIAHDLDAYPANDLATIPRQSGCPRQT